MEKDLLISFINLGKSQREIADELKCSQSNVKYWLKKFDLKTKLNQHNKKTGVDKVCPKCNNLKPLSEYYKRTNRDDYNGYCKKCSNDYHTERIKNVKIKMVQYKGGKCNDCNIELNDNNYCIFDFHHLIPSEKDPNFNKIKFQKWETIKNEIDKCDVLCSNCHRLKHHLIRMDGLKNNG